MLFIKSPKADARNARREKFEWIIKLAKTLRDHDPSWLHRLIVALLRPLQAEHLIAVAECVQHAAPEAIDSHTFFFPLSDVLSETDCHVQPDVPLSVDLSRDIVLPTPWKRRDYANALANIGEGRAMGAWEQDANHVVALWLPWRIGFVRGGNHSITAGILGGEGVVTATDVFDMRPLLNRVACDGEQYVEIASGRRVAKVTDHRRAAVFEIGRMLLDGPPQ